MVTGGLLLPLVYWPQAFHTYWAPKAAVGLVLVTPGLVALCHLIAARSRAAALAGAFLAWATLSTLLSDNVVLSLVGEPNWGIGLLFLALLVGAWALGACAGEARRHQLLMALVVAGVANAAVAWLQARQLVPPALESPVPGRAGGLVGNPVHLGALCAGALWLMGRRLGRERGSLWWLVAVAVVAGASELSGGRSAVALSLLAVVFTLPAAGIRRALAVAAAVGVGMVVAPLGAEDAVRGSGRAVGAESITHVDARLGLWRAGGEALMERPLVGWGPARFEAATTPRYTRTIAIDGSISWTDAHNWVVHHAVTTGLVGLGLLCAWLAAAGRASGGPLVGFALVVAASMLVEPQSVALTPLALLALGASSRRAPPGTTAGKGWRLVTVAGLVVGALGGAILLAGEVFLERGFTDASPPSYRRAEALLPPWPEVTLIGARVEAYHGLSPEGLAHRRRALALAREATRRDPADAASWAYLGALELRWGREEKAAAALGRAMERNPWSPLALRAKLDLAERRRDDAGAAESCDRLRRLGRAPPPCTRR
ncbi:MAG: O-antigen ligase family protein [Actinomycetota bacterium]|nr:O-antigen ligase family protein [Actinomycetota bacterium]